MASHSVNHSHWNWIQYCQVQDHQTIATMSIGQMFSFILSRCSEGGITRSPIITLARTNSSINYGRRNGWQYGQIQVNQTVAIMLHGLQYECSINRRCISLLISFAVVCFTKNDSRINLSYWDCWQLSQVQNHQAIAAVLSLQESIYSASTSIFFTCNIPCIRNSVASSIVYLHWSNRWQLYQVQAYQTVATMSVDQNSIYFLGTTVMLTSQWPVEFFAMASHSINHGWLNLWQYGQVQSHQTIAAVNIGQGDSLIKSCLSICNAISIPQEALAVADSSIHHCHWHLWQYGQHQVNQTIAIMLHSLQDKGGIYRSSVGHIARLAKVFLAVADCRINLSYWNCWQLSQIQFHHTIAAVCGIQCSASLSGALKEFTIKLHHGISHPVVGQTIADSIIYCCHRDLWQHSQIQDHYAIATVHIRQDHSIFLSGGIRGTQVEIPLISLTLADGIHDHCFLHSVPYLQDQGYHAVAAILARQCVGHHY